MGPFRGGTQSLTLFSNSPGRAVYVRSSMPSGGLGVSAGVARRPSIRALGRGEVDSMSSVRGANPRPAMCLAHPLAVSRATATLAIAKVNTRLALARISLCSTSTAPRHSVTALLSGHHHSIVFSTDGVLWFLLHWPQVPRSPVSNTLLQLYL